MKVTKEKIVERAMKDATFRQALISNPKATLASEYEIHIPDPITVSVVEETDEHFYLVIPKFPNEDDMKIPTKVCFTW